MTLTTISFTGHRPQDLGGYDEKNEMNVWVKTSLAKAIVWCHKKFNTTHWISGGALGVDQWAAEIVLILRDVHNLPFHLMIMKPFTSQHIKWSDESQKRFLTICDNADDVFVCQPDPYAAWKMQYRNKEMCKGAQMIIAVWNGNEGGTGNCVKYAQSLKMPILRINPIDRTVSWMIRPE